MTKNENIEKTETTSRFNTLLELCKKEDSVLTYGDLEVKVLPNVSSQHRLLSERMGVEMLFPSVKSGVRYLAAAKDFAKRYSVLDCFTDIEFDCDVNTTWMLVNYSPLYDDVVDIVGYEAVSAFLEEFEELIKVKQSEISATLGWKYIIDELGAKFGGLTDIFKNLDLDGILQTLGGAGGLESILQTSQK